MKNKYFSPLFISILFTLSFHPAVQAGELRVLTLNTWLLSFMGVHVGKDMPAREAILPRMLASTQADIIALQETWPNRYKRQIAEKLKEAGYPYSFYIPRELSLGNGLVIISRFPIVRTLVARPFHEYTAFDEITARKTVVYAEIAITPEEHLDFFTTHTGSVNYDKDLGSYQPGQVKRQLEQYLDVRDFILRNRNPNHKVILTGDFNADYRRLVDGHFLAEYSDNYTRLISGTCGNQENLLNTFLTANHLDQTSEASPSYDFQNNPYAGGGLFKGSPSETDDYIFTCGYDPSNITQSELQFTEAIPADLPELQGYSRTPLRLSDHYGLMTTLSD